MSVNTAELNQPVALNGTLCVQKEEDGAGMLGRSEFQVGGEQR